MHTLIEGKSLKLKFTGKLMTAYGGFALLARLFHCLDLERAITKMVPFVETSPNSTGVYPKVLKLGLTVAAWQKRQKPSAAAWHQEAKFEAEIPLYSQSDKLLFPQTQCICIQDSSATGVKLGHLLTLEPIDVAKI